MKKQILHCAAAALLVSGLGACKAATQNIPVSTNPSGAIVYADGTETCISPCNVELEKTQAHILTLKKDGYRQADIQISRQYDTGAVARGAVQSATGVQSQGASTEGAISNALLNTQAMEDNGSAYVLSPTSVVVNLVPEGQVRQISQPSQPQRQQNVQAQAPLVISSDQFDAADQEKLQQQKNQPITISSDQLAPADQQTTIQTTQPATMGSAVKEDPLKATESALEAGAIAAPTIGTHKDFQTSSHSSSSFDEKSGTYSESHSSSHVGVGVSVNPVEAGLGVLHLLEGAEKKEGTESE